jgi:hypothetical protein
MSTEVAGIYGFIRLYKMRHKQVANILVIVKKSSTMRDRWGYVDCWCFHHIRASLTSSIPAAR